jgi:hypothetical protein
MKMNSVVCCLFLTTLLPINVINLGSQTGYDGRVNVARKYYLVIPCARRTSLSIVISELQDFSPKTVLHCISVT